MLIFTYNKYIKKKHKNQNIHESGLFGITSLLKMNVSEITKMNVSEITKISS